MRIIDVEVPEAFGFLLPYPANDLIRVGRETDGGYVIARSTVDRSDGLVSLGVSMDWSFEEDFSKLKGEFFCHAYDHTVSADLFRSRRRTPFVTSGKFNIRPKDVIRNLSLYPRFAAFFAGDNKHFCERVVAEASADCDVAIPAIFARIGPARTVFFKCDIEGSEYEIIPTLMQFSSQISGMAFEFHEIGRCFEKFAACIELISREFRIVHVHANNCAALNARGVPDALEISFAREGDVIGERLPVKLPMALDRPCTKKKPDYALTFKAA